MKRSEICTRVRAAVDSLLQAREDGVTTITDYENLEEIIKDKIPYALVYILQNAASDLLDDAAEGLKLKDEDEEAGTKANYEQDGKVWKVKLPTGTLRIFTARLRTWIQAPEPIGENTPEALMQMDEYARGSWDRPVVILRRTGSELWLEFYSGKGTETKDDVIISYVKDPYTETSDTTTKDTDSDSTQTEAETDVEIPKKLEAAFIYQIAGLAMTAFREDISASLFAISNQYMGLSTINQAQEGA